MQARLVSPGSPSPALRDGDWSRGFFLFVFRGHHRFPSLLRAARYGGQAGCSDGSPEGSLETEPFQIRPNGGFEFG